ncbi:MAG TPA: hypothetical protein VHS05_07230 [Pyrinomonadaceae bacterium]|jgi:hypothetical protein|nr:hypothetical protein [Pyrinomonadaceae bacterium]
MQRRARQTIFVVTLLALTLSSVLTGPRAHSSNTQVPVITLSTVQGFSAEISDYFTDENGFTFTLTNRSSLALTVIGADFGSRIPVSIVSQSGPNFPFHVDAFIPGSEDFENKIAGVQMSFVLSSLGGVAPGQSTTITLGLGGDAEFLARHFFVSFFPEMQLACSQIGDKILIQFTKLSPTEQCLVFLNLSDEVLTGIAFDYPEDRGPFELLSTTPTPQPFGQHLRFSKVLEPIPGYSARSDFAILAGGRFAAGSSQIGIQPNETSSEFCYSGNFAGLTSVTPATVEAFETATYVRVNKTTLKCMLQGPPVGGGQTGLLAGSPR